MNPLNKVSLWEWGAVGTGNRTCRCPKNNQNWVLVLKKYNLMVFSPSCYGLMPQLLHVMTRHNKPLLHDLIFMMSNIRGKQVKISINISPHELKTNPPAQFLPNTAVRCFNQDNCRFQFFTQPKRDKVGPDVKHSPLCSIPSPASLVGWL